MNSDIRWVDGDIDGVVVKPLRMFTDARGWLAELFRSDEVDAGIMPVMAYVSVTLPGVSRGPHEHLEQTDYFGFACLGSFKLRLWDGRPDSRTRGRRLTIFAGKDKPTSVIVPPRIVHGYTNISASEGLVLNLPNRLYAGRGKKEPVDEIRYEDDRNNTFSMED